MIYIELYLYDYLKKKAGKREGIELWGEQRRDGFYICHLRMAGERKPFYKAHMQYLGAYQGLEDMNRRKMTLTYKRGEEVCRREATVYVAKETEQIEHFLISETLKDKTGAGNGLRKTGEIRKGEEQEGVFVKTAVCVMLIFLVANMVEALSSYKNMREVIEVVEMLVK